MYLQPDRLTAYYICDNCFKIFETMTLSSRKDLIIDPFYCIDCKETQRKDTQRKDTQMAKYNIQELESLKELRDDLINGKKYWQNQVDSLNKLIMLNIPKAAYYIFNDVPEYKINLNTEEEAELICLKAKWFGVRLQEAERRLKEDTEKLMDLFGE